MIVFLLIVIICILCPPLIPVFLIVGLMYGVHTGQNWAMVLAFVIIGMCIISVLLYFVDTYIIDLGV